MSAQSITGPIVLFLAIGLALGGVLRVVNRRTKFPYTPLLLITGILLTRITGFGSLGQGTHLAEQVNPHTILLVFIPVLIFESGFNCDWHIFRRSIFNILVLAGPGVLWGTILIASTFKIILGYDQLSWNEAFTMGSVLSATDPVAVVALLKELGASIRFNTLIEGESLLNDGTAMVFYYVFADMAKGKDTTVIGVVGKFIRFSLGGPALGVAMGMVCSWWMRRIVRDNVLTTSVTLIGCYLTFYLAEFTPLHVSGILALVVLGLYLSAVGKTNIYPESEHSLHLVWSYIQYACETIIFLLTGVIIGAKLVEDNSITFGDWVKMLAFWLLINLARFVMVITFAPILFNTGYPINKKEFIVLVYGGLRGALGLCLGLLANFDMDFNPRFRELTLFYISGIATLTLLVNGTTCGTLVSCIRMIEVSPIREKLLNSTLVDIDKQLLKKEGALKDEPYLKHADWDKVAELTKMEGMVPPESLRFSMVDSSTEDILMEFRVRILTKAKAICWERYQEGKCKAINANIFNEACDVMLDQPNQRLFFWSLLKESFSTLNGSHFMGPTILIEEQVQLGYDLCLNFLDIQSELRHIFSHYNIREQYIQKVFDELAGDKECVVHYLCDLEHSFSATLRSIQTRRALSEICFLRKHLLEKSLREGLIDQGQYKDQRVELDKVLSQMNLIPLQKASENPVSIDCPMLAPIPKEQIETSLAVSQVRTLHSNKLLCELGRQFRYFYIIRKGSLTERYRDFSLSKGPGSISCVMNAISTTGTSFCEIKTASECEVLEVPCEQFKKWTRSAQFMERVYRASFLAAAKSKGNKLSRFSNSMLIQLMASSRLQTLAEGSKIECEHGGFVFDGWLINRSDRQEQPYRSLAEVPPARRVLFAKERTVIMVFSIPPQSNHQTFVRKSQYLQ